MFKAPGDPAAGPLPREPDRRLMRAGWVKPEAQVVGVQVDWEGGGRRQAYKRRGCIALPPAYSLGIGLVWLGVRGAARLFLSLQVWPFFFLLWIDSTFSPKDKTTYLSLSLSLC